MEKTFNRVATIKDIAVFTSFILIGTALIIFPTGAGINLAGFFMILTGMILAFILRTGYKDLDSGVMYSKREYYFQQEMNPVISSALASMSGSIDLSQADKGKTVKLDIYYSKLTGKAYLQLFEYRPYKYEPCSQTYEYELFTVRDLVK